MELWQGLLDMRVDSDARPDVLTADAAVLSGACRCGSPRRHRLMSPTVEATTAWEYFAWMETLARGASCETCGRAASVRLATWLPDARLDLLFGFEDGERRVALARWGGTPYSIDLDDERLCEVPASAATRRVATDLDLTDDARHAALAGVVQRYGDYAPALREMARCLRLLERRAEAQEIAERAVAAAPHEADGWFVLGDVLDESFDYQGALFAYACCLALDPHHAEAHNQRGLVLRRVGRDGDAERAYEQALAAVPDHAAALHNCAVLAIHDGHLERALGLLARVRADDLGPDQVALRLSLYHAAMLVGRRLSDARDWDSALQGFELAAVFNHEPPSVWYGQACCHAALGQWTAALAAVHQTLSLDPEWPGARALLQRCREVFAGRRPPA